MIILNGVFCLSSIRQNRDRLVLATKCGRLSDPGYPNGEGASRVHIMSSIEASLKRLQTSYVDVFYVSQVLHEKRLVSEFSYEGIVTTCTARLSL